VLIPVLLAGCTYVQDFWNYSVIEDVYYSEDMELINTSAADHFEKWESSYEDTQCVHTIFDESQGIVSRHNGQLPNQKDAGKSEEGKNSVNSYAVEIPVLLYHHLLKQDENTFCNNPAVVSVELFEEQMCVLYEEGYHSITLGDLELFLKGEIQLPCRSVLITFDDGYKSNIHYAYPILKKYELRAAIFIVSYMISEETSEFDPTAFQYISWREMEEHKDVFEYACHSHNFHRLENHKSFLIAKPLEEVKEDLRMNLQTIHHPYFAYPYGEYDKNTISLLKELGFVMAFTIVDGNVKIGDDMYRLKRRSIKPDMSIDKFKKIIE
jgi:peptidoglycan/xylan/chitin deacetylase (PgdA/CDA1 family)